MTTFSQVLRRLREYKGLTQEELAKMLNITRSRLASYEQAQREPDLELLEIIADFFNVDMDYLLGRESVAFNTYNLTIKAMQKDDPDDDWTVEELKEIDAFKEFVRMKRKMK